MYRLLIVDDEQITLDGIKELFNNCDSLDLYVYTASSGIEAIEIIKKTGIDIVVSDIKMPGTDGIKLAQTIRTYWPRCKVIFLTGFNKVQYSVAAEKYGVIDYVMKSESDEAIINSVKRGIEMILEENMHVVTDESSTEIEDYTNTIMKNEFLFVADTHVDFDMTRAMLKKTCINPDEKFALLLGRIYNIDTACNDEYQNTVNNFIKLLKYNLKDRFNLHFMIRQNQLVWLIQKNENIKDTFSEINCIEVIKNILESVHFFLEGIIKGKIVYAIYSKEISFREFTNCHNKLSRCLNMLTNVNNGAIITENYQCYEQSVLNKTYDEFLNVMSNLETYMPYLKRYLNEGKKEDYFDLFDKITTPIVKSKYMNFSIMIEIYYSILNMIVHYINFNQLIEKIAFVENPVELYNISQYTSWNEPICNLKKISTILFDIKKGGEQIFSENVIKKVKDYINLNIGGDLSLNVLSEIVDLNPYYLSRYFKKVENKNISAYIEEVKFERAKVLLQNNELKIVDISKMLGFESSSYFSIRFRKYQKMSPQEYRDQMTS